MQYRIWNDTQYIVADEDDPKAIEAALRFKAENIKAKADPGLFLAAARWMAEMRDLLDPQDIENIAAEMEVGA